jgi:hypothetical protein
MAVHVEERRPRHCHSHGFPSFSCYSSLPSFLSFFFYFCEKFRLLSVTLSSSGLMALPLSLSFVATTLSLSSRNLSFLCVALESFLPEKQAILSRISAIFLLALLAFLRCW